MNGLVGTVKPARGRPGGGELGAEHRARRSSRGSIAVEYMGVLPLVLTVALLILQGLAAVAIITSAEDAARNAARAAVRGQDATVAAEDSLPSWLEGRMDRPVRRAGEGRLVTVTVEVDVPTLVSGFTGGSVTGKATFERR